MNRPTLPFDGECCESGCAPCVWGTYYAALRAWEAQQAALALPSTAAGAVAAHDISAPTH